MNIHTIFECVIESISNILNALALLMAEILIHEPVLQHELLILAADARVLDKVKHGWGRAIAWLPFNSLAAGKPAIVAFINAMIAYHWLVSS